MPRRVQDIIPSNHRSIRDIPAAESTRRQGSSSTPERSKKREQASLEKEEVISIHRKHTEPESTSPKKLDQEHILPHPKPPKKNRAKKARLSLILAVLVVIGLCAGAAFVLSGHFAGATFNLTPKILPVSINGTYIIPSIASGVFGYDTVSMSGTATTTVAAVQGSYTETKAQGSVLVYNSYSTQTQRLVAGTRLGGNSGLVYRLTSTIMVPGYTRSGSNVIPGSIVTSVTAEKSGQEYNISRTDTISDFKVIAYKGTIKYAGFYARLTTDVGGGFSGTRTTVAPTVLASTTVLLQQSLILDLQQKIQQSIPPGYVTYKNLYSTTVGAPLVTSLNASSAQISTQATVYGLIFKKTDLAGFLAGASSSNMFGSSGYTAPSIESLTFIFSNQKDFSPLKKTNLVARISGSFNLLGTIPVDAIKQDLAGLSLNKTVDILKKYVSVIDIAHSSAEISPPWITTVPQDVSRISIVVKSF
jgi:hypothetical protein